MSLLPKSILPGLQKSQDPGAMSGWWINSISLPFQIMKHTSEFCVFLVTYVFKFIETTSPRPLLRPDPLNRKECSSKHDLMPR